MINEKLGDLIIEATKSREKDKLRVLKLIKSEFQKVELSKPKEESITAAEEIRTLQKMIDQRMTSAKTYKDAGRTDLANIETGEIEIIKTFLPSPRTEKETLVAVTEIIASYGKGEKLGMKDLKPIIALVQKEYPDIQGGTIAKIFKSLNS
jgi:hypothetical protein